MKKKVAVIIVFLIGLGIFSYPIIADMFSTKAHQTILADYKKTTESLQEEEKAEIKRKATEHNKELEDKPMDFVDPFENGTENSGNKSYYSALNIGPAMGAVDIPSIGVNLPIYHGTSEEVLSQGVGHLENSSLPLGEKGTHSVLTAHRGLPSSKLFRNINDVAVGEEFKVQVLDDIMVYEVYDIDIVLPHETDWLQNEEDKSLVTLLSCEPYMINTHRMLVHGELIRTEKATDDDGVAGKQKKQDSNLFNFIIMGLALLGVFIMLYLIIKGKRRKQEEQ